MAKKKRKTKTKLKKQFQFELLGLFLILLSIFSSGASMISDGFIPTSLENVFKFFLGIWYFVLSVLLLIIGIVLVVKRKFPTFYSKRIVGLTIFFLGIILLTHIQTFDRLLINIENTSIIKASWDNFLHYTKGQAVNSQLGGGMIGAILFALTYFLFSLAGAKIIAVFSLLIGILFITNLSLGNVYALVRQTVEKVYTWLKKQRENKQKNRQAKKVIQDDPTPIINEETNEVTNDETTEPATPDEIDVQYSFDEEAEQLAFNVESEEELVDDVPLRGVELDDNSDYILPSMDLLDEPVKQTQQREKSSIQQTVNVLEETFQSFGVKAKITKANVGPAVTKYEVQPDAGVKVSRIINLQDDLALALAAQDIRIEAPIPGKSAIGIEVPNKEVATVSIREVLDSSDQPHKKLLFALGRDISGNVIEGELNKMPHILIAGATGSGKSVCINGIITSILMRAKPSEVKMMMIDPKKVELNVYNGIPHLLTPVVTDPKKASMALRKVVSEMEHRYELFSETGTRNLESYNKYIHKQNDLTDEQKAPLPYIVVLVDELADLMMVASKDVEDSITRLAQMARAAGIHLIIATQRPSVDVITGIIKANIPSRIAFSVSSQVDSRTILDMGGAEKLLGRGDMLYIPVGMSKPMRVQGAFLSDSEVERIVTHCTEQQQASYQDSMLPEAEEVEKASEATDELYDDAVQLVIEMQSASVSMLQRRFRIGYNRAARLIDEMEAQQIVGSYEGNKPRTVLITSPVEESSS